MRSTCMRSFFAFLAAIFVFSSLLSPPVSAQQNVPQEQYVKGKVLSIEREGTRDVGGRENRYQQVKIRLLDGPAKDKEIALEYGGMFTITESQKVREGDTVVLVQSQTQDNRTAYRILDKYRIPTIIILLFGFFAVVLAVAGKKGIGAILGIFISLSVIIFFIVPRILAGNDPLAISIIGAIIILIATMYLAHGFRQQTHIALAATLISLFLTALLSILFVSLARLSGLGTEDAYSLQQMFTTVNFKGLLLGGIIIGALGVLDDVTTTQAATVTELADADPKSTVRTLFAKGMNVGRTHIASVVNTLILAYAGASMGIFIFLVLGVQNNIQPLWVILNSEVITEEIVRSLAGSIGLILAVPITTLLAAFFAKYSVKIK